MPAVQLLGLAYRMKARASKKSSPLDDPPPRKLGLRQRTARRLRLLDKNKNRRNSLGVFHVCPLALPATLAPHSRSATLRGLRACVAVQVGQVCGTDVGHASSVTCGTVGQVNTSVGQVNTSVGQVNTSVGQVNTSVGQVNTSVGQVNTSVGQVNTSVGQVNTSVGRVNTSVGQVNTFVGQGKLTAL